MLKIDGSLKSGSGTILRIAVALSSILNEDLHIYNIRKKRPKPGLRPQHLEAVLTAAKIASADVKGAKVGSKQLWFKPGTIQGGKVHSQIGTAGSIPMLLLTVIPICLYAQNPVSLKITKGGTDVKNAPSINYLKYILLPTLQKMGITSSLKVDAYGYYPRGEGKVFFKVDPCKKLDPIQLPKFGSIQELGGLSTCTFLEDRQVAERQAKAAQQYLMDSNYNIQIDSVYDRSNPFQKGSSIVLWAKTDTDAILGADSIGELRKSSEAVGKQAAKNLLREVEARPTMDVHLSDMIIPYLALATKSSTFLTRELTEHLDTNIWLLENILGITFNVRRKDRLFQIEKA